MNKSVRSGGQALC